MDGLDGLLIDSFDFRLKFFSRLRPDRPGLDGLTKTLLIQSRQRFVELGQIVVASFVTCLVPL